MENPRVVLDLKSGTLLPPNGRNSKSTTPEMLRQWGADLLTGDPLVLGRNRCHQLARLTGVDPEPIWQWGFIERTSTGLLLLQLALDALAHEFLAVADAWAKASDFDL
jgi:hypothetical protein